MHPPAYWYRKHTPPFIARIAASVYRVGLRRRQRKLLEKTPPRPGVFVITVGNAIIGGSGKTPIVIALSEALAAQGHAVAVVSRGYGGKRKAATPRRVRAGDSPRAVGDEACMMAKRFLATARSASSQPVPVVVGRRRGDAVTAAAEHLAARPGGDEKTKVIISDDGFLNVDLRPDYRLLAIGSEAGFGNGHVFPAGPLREPLADALGRADGVVITDPSPPPLAVVVPVWQTKSILANLPVSPDTAVFAFAGIANPNRFFGAVANHCYAHSIPFLGAFPFPDHHAYTMRDLSNIQHGAHSSSHPSITYVTTAKDAAKLDVPEFVAHPLMVSLSIAHQDIHFQDSSLITCLDKLIEEISTLDGQ